MKIDLKNSNTKNSLDDIVFEGRNKLYGAYLLRKGYQNHLIYGLAISILVVLVLVFLLVRITNRHDTDYYLNPSPYGHSVDVDLSDKAFGLRSVKPKGASAPPDFVLPRIVTDLEEEQPSNEKSELNSEGNNDTTSSTKSGTGNQDGGDFSNNGDGIQGEVYGTADIYPQFPGGPKAMQVYINENLDYPEIARRMGIKGTIQIYIVITKTGSLRDIKIVKGLQPELDEEAVRVIKSMPLWNPAMRAGVPVNVRCVIPISVSPLK